VATIWFEIVDSYIQHRSDQADDDNVKAENKQAAAPKSLRAPFFSYTSSLVAEKRSAQAQDLIPALRRASLGSSEAQLSC
jgi:hypothetical protein